MQVSAQSREDYAEYNCPLVRDRTEQQNCIQTILNDGPIESRIRDFCINTVGNPATNEQRFNSCVSSVNASFAAAVARDEETREQLAEDGSEDDSEGLPAGAALTEIGSVDCSSDEYSTDILGIPVWYKYLDVKKDVYVYDNGQSVDGKCTPRLTDSGSGIDPTSALPIGLAVLEAMMVIAGLVAVVMIFWGSFLYLVSQGESDKAAGARKTVINAAIGLVIVIIATRVVSFIATRLTS